MKMRTFVNPVHLVTTTDGLRPENFVEVHVLPMWEAAVTKKSQDAFEEAVAEAKADVAYFGTGVIKLLPDGTVQHVPLHEVQFGIPSTSNEEQK